MSASRTIITQAPLSVDEALRAVSTPRVGGVGLFVGMVRDHDPAASGATVEWLEYSSHPSAEEELAASAARILGSHQIETIYAAHRVGRLQVGDIAVITAAGAPHRAPAIAASHALIDDLKHTVPIWKRQGFTDGESSWVGL